MKKTLSVLLFFVILFTQAQENSNPVKELYHKKEVYITMRDGVRLFTSVYIPKDASADKKYPVLMQRTCYSVAPYGDNEYRKSLGPNRFMQDDKYIFVYQDVRGRYMSEGTFVNMTPQVSHKTKKEVDESTDTYDTIDWLIKNIDFNNGKVGQYGISYPGFYTAVGALADHPALKASSPQAPVSDFWNDDFHHNGAFLMGYFRTFPVFGVQKSKPEKEAWYKDDFKKLTENQSADGSLFYDHIGTMKEAVAKYYPDNFFMKEIVEHPNYDEFWQKRNLLPHLKNIRHAVMTVGGWFDAEDLAGPLNIYKTIEKNNPKIYNTIVMGPFSHGGWSRESGKTYHNDIYFGDSLATFYQKNIETPFFQHFLKDDKKQLQLPEAYMFDTGKKEWKTFAEWPPKQSNKRTFYLEANGSLTSNQPNVTAYTEYFSDPNKPVPSSENRRDFNGFSPRNYMSEDQRFAENRPDVASFTTDVLTEDLTLTGEILAKLSIASTSTDADFFVKLIDIYPPDEKENPDKPNVLMANYHQMVRSEIMPARFRNSAEKPEALKPNQETAVTVRLQDVFHTFKKGHKIQIQVQSTAYPLFMVNSQKFLENPYLAEKSDYTKAFQRIFNHSKIEVQILKD